jgi:hypothetical protein
MANIEWKVVDDRMREGADKYDAIAKELLAGKTVHVTGITNSDLSSWYTRMKLRSGRLLRRRLSGLDPSEGYIVWLADGADADSNAAGPETPMDDMTHANEVGNPG